MKTILEDYTKKIHIRRFSALILNPLKKPLIISNMPQEWETEFLCGKFQIFSDIVSRVKSKITPLVWNAEEVKTPGLVSLARKFDIQNGMTFLIRISSDVVIFTLYFDKDDKRFISLYQENKYKILFDVLELFEVSYQKSDGVLLTARESEVLELLKIGKTYSEIAFILGISKRTVRFHIENILNKLDVTSVKYAIFKAISLDLI
jgi:LuxR family quorum-sensing system transcriptional regulator ExpR